MAHSRDSENGDQKPAKRQKTSGTAMDPRNNPYLAHHYEEDESAPLKSTYNSKNMSPMSNLPRHETTAAQAMELEDRANNPYTGSPFSQRYFNILKVRRGLPVHAQRYVSSPSIVYVIGTNIA
jgi:pre-mRNA-splicing factor ATP-dependent RNA helicase DHX15/PRP43